MDLTPAVGLCLYIFVRRTVTLTPHAAFSDAPPPTHFCRNLNAYSRAWVSEGNPQKQFIVNCLLLSWAKGINSMSSSSYCFHRTSRLSGSSLRHWCLHFIDGETEAGRTMCHLMSCRLFWLTPKCRGNHGARFGLYLCKLTADASWVCREDSRWLIGKWLVTRWPEVENSLGIIHIE